MNTVPTEGESHLDASRPHPRSAQRYSAARRHRDSGPLEIVPATLQERLTLARSETDGNRRAAALEAVAWEAVGTDTSVFEQAYAALAPDSPEARRLLSHEGGRYAEADPESALALAQSLASEAPYAEFVGAIAVALAEKNPQGSAELVASLADESIQQRCAVQVLQRWSATDPSAAAAWVTAFPQGAARSAGLLAVIQSWLTNDPPRLAEWLHTPAAQGLRGESLSTLATLIAQQPDATRAASLLRFPQIELPPSK